MRKLIVASISVPALLIGFFVGFIPYTEQLSDYRDGIRPEVERQIAREDLRTATVSEEAVVTTTVAVEAPPEEEEAVPVTRAEFRRKLTSDQWRLYRSLVANGVGSRVALRVAKDVIPGRARPRRTPSRSPSPSRASRPPAANDPSPGSLEAQLCAGSWTRA